MSEIFEVGDSLKVLEPEGIIAGYDLTEGKEYEIKRKTNRGSCHIIDDKKHLLYVSIQEVLRYCEVIKKEKRGSMLEVKVVKDETKTVEDKWKAGNILSNEDGSTVIMLVKTEYLGEKVVALFLKHDVNPNREYCTDGSSQSFWLEKCPILVSKSELNIEI